MDEFAYRNGRLFAESAAVADIAAAVGTPCYVYSRSTLLQHYDRFAEAFAPLDPVICYSVKSSANVHLCRLLAGRGSGFDVVSGGELHRALAAGADPGRIVFAGVGKTDSEMLAGIDARIGWFNVESELELEVLCRIAAGRGARVRAALRVNPDVDAGTHAYTTTGRKETKFGVDIDRARRVFDAHGDHPNVHLCGLHLHIGSPVNSVAPYVAAVRKGLELIDQLRASGRAIDTFDIGGGFGAHYRAAEAPPAAEYAAALAPLLRGRGLRIILEPGRSIVANAGILLTRVLYTKQSGDRRFVICDAGMNDLIRPALYEAFHFIWPVQPRAIDATAQGAWASGSCKRDPRGMGASPVPGSMLINPREENHNDKGPRESEIDRFETKGHNLQGSDAVGDLTAVDIVGPVCETGDFFAHGRALPPLERGDLLAIFTAGAYGMSMASNYNSRPRACEVLVEGERFRVIRRRETYEDLLAAERFAD